MERLQHGNPEMYRRTEFKFNPEELAFLEECNKEAFVKRGLPYTIGCMGGMYVGVKCGYFKPSNLMGKIAFAGLFGYFTGMVSYKFVCARKLLSLPNVNLKQRLQEAQMTEPKQQKVLRDGFKENLDSLEEQPVRVQSRMNSNLDMDTYQAPHDFDGFTGVNTDGDSRSSIVDPRASDFSVLEPLDKYGHTPTTYDELRHKNREDYVKSQSARRPAFPTDNTKFAEPQTPLPDASYFGDRDRVPQYQLVD